jgi:hypothetical protein
MKAEWLEIKRGDVLPQYAGIYVTMNAAGHVVLSRVTYEMLGAPEAFGLLYDRVNNRIGLKPTHMSMKNAYPVRVSNKSGAKMIKAYRLISEHRIKLPHTVKFEDAEIDEDGILVLDLRTAVACRRGLARARRNTSVN